VADSQKRFSIINSMTSPIIEEVKPYRNKFEQEVEGLIELCKFLADQPQEAKDVVKFMPLDPHVVVEAKRRVLKGFNKLV
jgi:hypothetical protein